MTKKKSAYYLAGVVLLLVFAGFSFSEFKSSLTPYVPYEMAMKAQRTVQVAGPFGAFRTWVREEGQRRLVRNRTLLALTEETPDVPVLPSADPDEEGDDGPPA